MLHVIAILEKYIQIVEDDQSVFQRATLVFYRTATVAESGLIGKSTVAVCF